MKKNTKLQSYSIYGVLLLIGALLLFLILYYSYRPLVPKIQINNTVFTSELVLSEQEKRKGLSGRTTLEDTHGMLFVYDAKGRYSFWMNGMLIPLDFIWIDDNTVVDIDENIQPPTVVGRILTLEPDQPVNRVFEVPAGTVQKYDIKVGDSVTYLRK